MIKLIATDIDGTIVKDSSPEVHKEFPEIIKKLVGQGIIFVVASGRQYESIKSMFHEVADSIVYVAENGAHIVYKGQNLAVTKMNQDYAMEIISQMKEYQDTCDYVISTPNGCYLDSKNQEFVDLIHYGYHNRFTQVEDVLKEELEVIKAALYRKGSIREIGEKVLIPRWDSKVKVCMAGEEWVDFMDTTVNKGKALSFLQSHFGIDKSETMVFGDNLNDIEMLLDAEESYAVENAREEVKAVAKYICPPYYEQGVYQVLKKKFLI